jgi:hypothetical protein
MRGDAWDDVIPNHPVTRYAVLIHESEALGNARDNVATAWEGGAGDGVEIEADGHYETMEKALADPTSCLGCTPL